MSEAQRILDQAQSLSAIEALAEAPGRYAEVLGDELPQAVSTLGEFELRDAFLTDGVAAIDTLTARVMRIMLDHALASDTSIGAPTRKVFASTIVSYAHKLEVLEQRARDQAARGGASDPREVADAVVQAAQRALNLREGIIGGLLGLTRDVANASIADANRRAIDRTLDDVTRRKWSAARRELEAVAADPARIAIGPWSARIAEHPEQLDEPEPEPEVTFADMIELD